jgi:hypothetical protein
MRYSETKLRWAAAAETAAWIAALTIMLTTGDYFPFSWIAPGLFLFAYIGGFITAGWLADYQVSTNRYDSVNWMMASLVFPPIVLPLLIFKTL